MAHPAAHERWPINPCFVRAQKRERKARETNHRVEREEGFYIPKHFRLDFGVRAQGLSKTFCIGSPLP